MLDCVEVASRLYLWVVTRCGQLVLKSQNVAQSSVGFDLLQAILLLFFNGRLQS